MKQVYQSEDGKIFSTAAECTAHENKNTATHYFRCTYTDHTKAPACYAVKLPKQYEHFSEALFEEFITNLIGPRLSRKNSHYASFNTTLSVLYVIDKITADAYNKNASRHQLHYDAYAGYLVTFEAFKLSSDPSLKAEMFNNLSPNWGNIPSSFNTTPVKVLTTDDLKSLNINEYLFSLSTADLKSLKDMNEFWSNKDTQGFCKKSITITDLLY